VTALRQLIGELAGLFVEDRLFALAIAASIVFAFVLSATSVVPAAARGVVLFVVLAATLVGGVVRGARTP